MLIGLSLALSSTAIVIEHLSQKRRINTVMGRASFSVLLFQDLAVVPILLLVGVLGTKPGEDMIVGVVLALALAAAGIAAIVVLGRILLRPLFRLVAATESSELFVAATLLVAIGTGVLSASVGLSMSLGAFTVGLLLAETEYRKAIEATIEPFKGLLLGVFFISIGMKIDLVALVSEPLYVVACALGLVALKAALIAPLARASGVAWPSALHMGLLLGPGGEFAFIVIGLAMAAGIMTGEIGGLLLTVVALSMSAIPVFESRRAPRTLAREGGGGARGRARRGPARGHRAARDRRRLRPGGRARRRDAAHARRPPRRDGAQSGRRGARARAATTCSSATPRTRSSCAAAGWRPPAPSSSRSARAARSTTSSPSPAVSGPS